MRIPLQFSLRQVEKLRPRPLLSDVQLFDQNLVPARILTFHVVQETATGTDHLQKTPAGMMVLLVALEMRGQAIDPFGQQGNLDLGRAGIVFMNGVVLDQLVLFGLH
jgi:hypothetical protein